MSDGYDVNTVIKNISLVDPSIQFTEQDTIIIFDEIQAHPDTGLLVSALDDEAQKDLRVNKNLGVYKGALYENFIAEAFVKQGIGLYYYKKENSTLEEDFFGYKDIRHGIKLGDFNMGQADGIFTFPYFCAFLMKEYLKDWD